MNLLQPSVPNNCDMHIHHRATSSVDINAQNYPERGRTVLIIQHVYNHGSDLQKWRKSSLKTLSETMAKQLYYFRCVLKGLATVNSSHTWCLLRDTFSVAQRKIFFFFFLEGGNVAWGQRHRKIYIFKRRESYKLKTVDAQMITRDRLSNNTSCKETSKFKAWCAVSSSSSFTQPNNPNRVLRERRPRVKHPV